MILSCKNTNYMNMKAVKSYFLSVQPAKSKISIWSKFKKSAPDGLFSVRANRNKSNRDFYRVFNKRDVFLQFNR